jgi:hypothetical protein
MQQEKSKKYPLEKTLMQYSTKAKERKNLMEHHVLGERTSFPTNKLPCNIKLLKDQDEHIIIAGLDRNDRFNFRSTMLDMLDSMKGM